MANNATSIRDIGQINPLRKRKRARDLLIVLTSDNDVISDPKIIMEDGLIYSEENKWAFMHLEGVPHYRWGHPYEFPYEVESRLLVASEPIDPDYNSEFVNRVIPAATRKTTAGRKAAIRKEETAEGKFAYWVGGILALALFVQIVWGYYRADNAPPPAQQTQSAEVAQPTPVPAPDGTGNVDRPVNPALEAETPPLLEEFAQPLAPPSNGAGDGEGEKPPDG